MSTGSLWLTHFKDVTGNVTGNAGDEIVGTAVEHLEWLQQRLPGFPLIKYISPIAPKVKVNWDIKKNVKSKDLFEGQM